MNNIIKEEQLYSKQLKCLSFIINTSCMYYHKIKYLYTIIFEKSETVHAESANVLKIIEMHTTTWSSTKSMKWLNQPCKHSFLYIV